MKRDFALYQVALKLLLKKGNKILFLRMAVAGKVFLDLPGGRIDNVEVNTPLEKILAREIREELGPKIKYSLGKLLFQFRRQVPSKKGIYNFLTVYGGRYISGKIKLSFEHKSYEWVDPEVYKFRKKDFMSGEEYKAFMRFFETS